MDSFTTIVGNLTRDPELRYTPNGTAVANFSVAVNRRWKNNKTDEWEEQVSFFNVQCWSDLATNVTESLDKGTRVMVSGRLEQRSWETNEGDKRTVVEIVADEIGPSLRWATVSVQRNERKERVGAGVGGGTKPVANAPDSGTYDPAEEPF